MDFAAPPSRLPAIALVVVQLILAVAGIGVATLAATGGDAVLLVPLTPAAQAALPSRALVSGTRLLAAGILPGSLIVRRDDGAKPAPLASGVVAIRVPVRLCGAL